MFELTPLDQGFALEMDTTLENVDRCVDQIRIFLEERNASEHLFPLSLLAREALNNAMIHGNNLDRTKTVLFRLLARADGFDLQVMDEGPGFAWDRHMQARSQADDVSGRGHEIFRNYAKAARYNTKGNALTLEYRG